ncbi:MAG: nuclear transport factor 2 family protein [Rhodothermales bacterium]
MLRRIASWLLLALLLLAIDTSSVAAQTPEEEVRAAVEYLFDGMRAGDSTMVRSIFYESALLGRAFYEGDTSVLRAGPVDGFVRAVGSPHDQVWDERIWDVTIRVDQNLASAWMQYAFYLGDQFHHCGVNSMQLFRSDEGWKIVYLLDTDRGDDCTIPDWE